MSIEPARQGRGHVVRWREHGRQRSRKFDRARDAKNFDAELRRRRQLGPMMAVQLLTERGGPSLDQWIEHRWAPEHAVTLEQSTRDRYSSVWECHIAGRLGDLSLGEITVSEVRAWQAELVRAGVNAGTIHKCRTFLSSVLRHAAESEAIPGNPVSLVKAPRSSPRDAVRPLAPMIVEQIRAELAEPRAREVAASLPGQRRRRRYELPAPGTRQTRRLDALIVSLLAYAGLRPGELRALRWSDVGEGTLHVQRAANPDGSIKATKTGHGRVVQLPSPLEQELREYRMASGRPPDASLVLAGADGGPWNKTAWQIWHRDRWAPACRAIGLDPPPHPYALRHSFVSLLLAARRDPAWVAAQAGHTPAVMVSTYWHLVREYEGREGLDPEREIAAARETNVRSECATAAGRQV